MAFALASRVAAARPTAVAGRRSAVVARPARVAGAVAARPAPKRASVAVKATDNEVDVDAIVKDIQQKWDAVEDKPSAILYAGGAVVLLWLASTVVGAVNAVPLLPKLLELVGLGYTSWFVYRYLLFKSSREELLADIEELKKKITS